jgi:hypothetical protein
MRSRPAILRRISFLSFMYAFLLPWIVSFLA